MKFLSVFKKEKILGNICFFEQKNRKQSLGTPGINTAQDWSCKCEWGKAEYAESLLIDEFIVTRELNIVVPVQIEKY